MRILFTNDDGYDSEGLHAVADLFKDEHEIAVVAPNMQKSGFSHSLTMQPNSVSVTPIEEYGYMTYAIGGTPVDCVKFAVTQLFPSPDLVVSGINRGRNLGGDIMYSGTVSAASDAVFLGYRAIALSLFDCSDEKDGFARCARFFKTNFERLTAMTSKLSRDSLLNVNFPFGQPKGVKLAKMSTAYTYKDKYIGGSGGYLLKGYREDDEATAETDESYCLNGYITITPLTIDRTDYSALVKFKREKFVL